MTGKRVLGIVLAGGAGKALAPLTAERAKAAVTFGGLYRVVDFALFDHWQQGRLSFGTQVMVACGRVQGVSWRHGR